MKDTRRDSEVLTAKTVASFVHDEYHCVALPLCSQIPLTPWVRVHKVFVDDSLELSFNHHVGCGGVQPEQRYRRVRVQNGHVERLVRRAPVEIRGWLQRHTACAARPPSSATALTVGRRVDRSPSASSLKGASIRAYSRLDVAGSACAAFLPVPYSMGSWVTSAEIPRRPQWGMFDLSSVIQVSCSRFVECSEFTEFVYNIDILIVESTEPACRTPSLSRISRGHRTLSTALELRPRAGSCTPCCHCCSKPREGAA
ncbi:hypothetical protein GQ600_4605 [Phytophthora cactorum]|nr:hypothetical protein GQ600_4605 [Phytophthora cactorum]